MAKNIRKRHKGTKSGGKPSLGSHPNVSLDGTGYDWGWPAIELAWANDELVRRLRAGGFVGCGYGLLSAGGPPFLALVGENVKGMRSALALMREWADAVGPNAISVEILFDGAGYVISVGQQPDLLRWRLRGIDPSEDALVFGISLSKRLDTRHPFLDQLADYSRQPVAPVYLTIASVPPDAVRRPGALDAGALASMDRQGLMLPGIRVYVRPEDLPIDSFIRLESEMPSE